MRTNVYQKLWNSGLLWVYAAIFSLFIYGYIVFDWVVKHTNSLIYFAFPFLFFLTLFMIKPWYSISIDALKTKKKTIRFLFFMVVIVLLTMYLPQYLMRASLDVPWYTKSNFYLFTLTFFSVPSFIFWMSIDGISRHTDSWIAWIKIFVFNKGTSFQTNDTTYRPWYTFRCIFYKNRNYIFDGETTAFVYQYELSQLKYEIASALERWIYEGLSVPFGLQSYNFGFITLSRIERLGLLYACLQSMPYQVRIQIQGYETISHVVEALQESRHYFLTKIRVAIIDSLAQSHQIDDEFIIKFLTSSYVSKRSQTKE